VAVSKRTRFEIFKRDAFTCQYCGRTPPTVVLECDHVTPVAGGGGDEEDNLITACFDCNRGKSDVPLAVVIPSTAERMAREQELADQSRAYSDFKLEQRKLEEAEIDDVGRIWFNNFKKKKDEFAFGPGREPTIRTFLRRLTKAEVLEAIEIAHQRKPIYSHKGDDSVTFRYFCGVCWNMIRNREGTNQ
jgi:hypothetical protein